MKMKEVRAFVSADPNKTIVRAHIRNGKFVVMKARRKPKRGR